MSFPDLALIGVFFRNCVYEHVTGWESFEPALNRAEQIDQGALEAGSGNARRMVGLRGAKHSGPIPNHCNGNGSGYALLSAATLTRKILTRGRKKRNRGFFAAGFAWPTKPRPRSPIGFRLWPLSDR